MEDLEKLNAQFIQQLNYNIKVLDTNMQTMMKELARDIAAVQRALVEFLQMKEIIATEEDLQLLRKLHLKHVAKIDQETMDQRKKDSL